MNALQEDKVPCPKCGKEVRAANRYCPFCAAPLQEDLQPLRSSSRVVKRARIKLPLLIAVTLVAGIFVCYFFQIKGELEGLAFLIFISSVPWLSILTFMVAEDYANRPYVQSILSGPAFAGIVLMGCAVAGRNDWGHGDIMIFMLFIVGSIISLITTGITFLVRRVVT